MTLTTKIRSRIFVNAFACLISIAVFIPYSTTASNLPSTPFKPKIPEATSTLLKIHRIYSSHPPHDTSLYDVMQVSPNATNAQIQQSYRKISRKYHPDKVRHRSNTNLAKAEEKLNEIQRAYNILEKDETRLPYHKYGLISLHTAVNILSGYQNTHKLPSSEEKNLLYLMGYHKYCKYQQSSPHPPPPSRRKRSDPIQPMPPKSTPQIVDESDSGNRYQQRITFLAVTILERIRPLVEGTISERTFADNIAAECRRLKALPLGAQIIRCIGRAYRHSGKSILRQEKHYPKPPTSINKVALNHFQKIKVPNPVRDKWHDTKHVWTAAMATGKVALQEQWLLSKTKKRQKSNKDTSDVENKPAIAYYDEEDEFSSSDDDDSALEEERMMLETSLKAQQVMLQLMQVEALWKVSKIGLDRAIRDACDLILSGHQFFVNPNVENDGWVTSPTTSFNQQPSIALDVRTGRLRAAHALVLMGNVMVQSSKEGTSWIE